MNRVIVRTCLAAFVLVALVVGGLAIVRARRPLLNLDDLAVSVAIASRDPDGVPLAFEVRYRNVSPAAGAFPIPQPLPGLMEGPPSAPVLGLLLTDSQGEEEVFAYAEPDRASERGAKLLSLAPGKALPREYSARDFWMFGPCGVDRWGSFQDYFSKGDSELKLQAVVMLVKDGESVSIDSEPVTFRGSFQPWLFKPAYAPWPSRSN